MRNAPHLLRRSHPLAPALSTLLSPPSLIENSLPSLSTALLQILLCTAVFSFICLPPDLPISPSNILSHLPDPSSLLPPSVAALLPSLPPLPSLPSSLFAPLSNLTLDEDIIIALALSLSSSAFVLNLLDERKELGTTHGAATLGVLLMQVGLRVCAPLCVCACV